ncbi:MAG: response regulator [Anaerolineales bacterium]
MNNKLIRVLLIEDNPGDARLIRGLLKEAEEFEFKVEHVTRLRDGLRRHDQEAFDIVLLDLRLPDSDGFHTLVRAQKRAPDMPIVVLTGLDDESFALEAVGKGAQDYLIKGQPDSRMLARSIHYAIERKRGEEALRDSEERFRSVAETAIDAIVLTDGGGAIQYWNNAAELAFGYHEEQALGKSLSQMIAIDKPDNQEAQRDSIHVGEATDLIGKTAQMTGIRSNGELFPMDLSLSSWVSRGERYFSAIIRDLSEIKDAQERAQQQDRLAAVGQLAAGIAHDFNNIMAAIILYSEMVMSSLELSSKSQERMKTVLNQAERAVLLVRQILDFSRRAVLEPHAMDLVPFMRELQALLRRTLPENIDVSISHQQLSHVVIGDPTRLQQVFMNLALNSRDAMQEGGELRFELDDLLVGRDPPPSYGELTPGKWIRIRICDTGTGVPPDALPHIFEPFFTTKPPGEGTGLGLAQVYGIVKQHEGHIDVVSRDGQGTEVILLLPMAEDDVPIGLIPDPVIPEHGTDETILVVEDDTPTLKAVGEILESLDYQVLLAEDGKQALEIIERNAERINAVLSDLVMPSMGGAELFTWLRKVHPEIPLVLMTGYPLGEETHELLEEQTVTWIEKPLRSDILAQTLRGVLTQ